MKLSPLEILNSIPTSEYSEAWYNGMTSETCFIEFAMKVEHKDGSVFRHRHMKTGVCAEKSFRLNGDALFSSELKDIYRLDFIKLIMLNGIKTN